MNDNDRTRFHVDNLASTFSPTSVKLAVDGTEYDTSVVTTGSGPYVSTVTTTAFFAGPAHATPAGATVLAYGLHTVEVRITGSDGTTLAKQFPSFRIQP